MPIIAVIGIFVLTLLLNASITLPRQQVIQTDNTTAPVSKTAALYTPTYTGNPHFYIVDQNPSPRVSILSLAMQSKGFFVIRDDKTNEILATSHLLEPGLYTGGSIALTKPVVSGQKLTGTIYKDNGDGILEPSDITKDDKTTPGDVPQPLNCSFEVI